MHRLPGDGGTPVSEEETSLRRGKQKQVTRAGLRFFEALEPQGVSNFHCVECLL